MSDIKKSIKQKIVDFWVPQKDDSKKKKLGKIISLVVLVVLAICIVLLCLILIKYAKPKFVTDTYSDLYTLETSSKLDNDVMAGQNEIDQNTGFNKDFTKLLEVNSDTVGFISIPNTKLAYPVVKGKNNNFYLNKTLYKKETSFGIPFVDYRATISPDYQSTNVTIYGHSALDGSFFSIIKEYKNLDFYKQHPTLVFNTIMGDGEYKILGMFMEDVNAQHGSYFNYHDFVDAIDDKHVSLFVQNVLVRSYFNAPVDIEPTDQFVTLSTCDTEINKTDFRIVLVARKIRKGESSAVDVEMASINQEQIMPKLWVDKKGKKNIYS